LIVTDGWQEGAELGTVCAHSSYIEAGEFNCADSTRANLADELGIIDIVFPWFSVDIIENHQQHAGYYHPENQVFCHIIQGLISLRITFTVTE
jgi:hypothetical protein